MPNNEIDLKHAQAFIDIVFGVLIGFLLINKLPLLTGSGINLPSIGSLFLLTAVLIFISFYWFEVRRFIDDQSQLDAAIGKGGLSLGRTLGSVIMVPLLVAIIMFTGIDKLRPFLIANLFFWLIDLGGNILLKLRYKQGVIRHIKRTHPDQYKWYMNNIKPRRKGPFYSSMSIVFFGLLLALDYIIRTPIYPFIAAVSIFLFTLVRHLYLRVKF